MMNIEAVKVDFPIRIRICFLHYFKILNNSSRVRGVISFRVGVPFSLSPYPKKTKQKWVSLCSVFASLLSLH